MDPKRLYVGNLPDDASVEALRTCFARHGAVADVYMAVDRASGRALRYAFVTMSTEADARAAIAGLDGAMFEGMSLRVNEAGANRDEDGPRRHGRSEAAKRNARAAVITSQFREAHNMTYEVDCSGTTLCIRVFPIDQEKEAWRLEASVRGSATHVSSGICPTRAAALAEIVTAWDSHAETSPVDWPAVSEAMASVRAV